VHDVRRGSKCCADSEIGVAQVLPLILQIADVKNAFPSLPSAAVMLFAATATSPNSVHSEDSLPFSKVSAILAQ
jgi:hypothetical protein